MPWPRAAESLALARANFEERGFADLGQQLSPDRLEALREELAVWRQSAPKNPYGLLANNLWRTLPGFEALVREGAGS